MSNIALPLSCEATGAGLRSTQACGPGFLDKKEIDKVKFHGKTGSWQLEEADAAVIKAMLARGDKQHDIAAFFGVNGGRIAEIAAETKFVEVSPASDLDLPPVGVAQRLMPILIAAIGTCGEDAVRHMLETMSND